MPVLILGARPGARVASSVPGRGAYAPGLDHVKCDWTAERGGAMLKGKVTGVTDMERMTVLGAYELDERGAIIRRVIDPHRHGDHGADPLGDGKFRMVPSGDIVDFAERNRRLAPITKT